MATYEQLPHKLQSLKGAAILSTEFLGAIEEDGSYSYAYKFSTSQDTYYGFRWDVMNQLEVEAPAEWLAKNDASKWQGSRDQKKLWDAKIKDELIRVRKNLIQDTIDYYKEEIKGNEKGGIANLKTESNESEHDITKALEPFKKSKDGIKAWRSVKL